MLDMEDIAMLCLIVGLVVFSVGIYFIPTFAAVHARHVNRDAILALNLLLGWTFIGWVIALVWALTKPRQ